MLTDLHALKNISIICVILLYCFDLSPKASTCISYWGIFSTGKGRKWSPVLKSCHQEHDTGKDDLSSPYYFPEQAIISSIFHAYGHECLALPYLNVNKTGIS